MNENVPLPTDVFAYFKYWQKQVDPVIAVYLSSEQQRQYAKTSYGSEVMLEISDLTFKRRKKAKGGIYRSNLRLALRRV